MKFAIFDHLDRGDTPLPQFYEERLQLVERADALGITSYHLAEHHWNPVGMAPNPSIFLGAIASRTKRIRFGPLAYALAFHNPLILAEEIAMLDQMSNGRLDLGVGRGISPWELMMFGYNLPETRDLFRESMDLMLQYFTSDMVTHRGQRWQYYEIPVEIDTVQKPFPPLWYGSSSGATRDYIASLGASVNSGWAPSARIKGAAEAYRAAWKTQKDAPFRAHTAAEPTLGSVRMTVIADTQDEADAIARDGYDRWQASLEKQAHDFGFRTMFLPPNYEAARQFGTVIAGTPDQVRDMLAKHIEESTVNYVCLQLAFGNVTHAQSMRTLELFASEVAPKLPNVELAA